MPEGQLLVLDANVLIDYCAADRSVLSLISVHVGHIHVPSVLLEEVDDLDESECERLGLSVMEPPLAMLAAAATRRPGLSYQDHLCLLAAKQEGWICVTNDGRLRRECAAEGVAVLWGLEPMIDLVAVGQLEAAEAKRLAASIRVANPHFVTEGVVAAFGVKVDAAVRTRKRR